MSHHRRKSSTSASRASKETSSPFRSDSATPSLDGVAGRRSAILQSIMDKMRENRGGIEAACGGEAADLIIGIPVPLAFQFLIQNNVLPFHKCTVLVGEEGVCKSALLFEMGRWCCEQGGFMHLVENETKFDPIWCNSIIGYADECGGELYNYYQSTTLEEWQNLLLELVKETKNVMLDQHGPGKTFPVLFGLDSIAGKLSQSTINKIREDGFAGRGAPAEAMAITKFMKQLTSELAGWPFLFCGVNHEKTAVEMSFGASGAPKVYRPGGKHMDYQEALEVRLSTSGKSSRITLLDDNRKVLTLGGVRVRLTVRKNSEGEGYRDLAVNVMWNYRKHGITGQLRQYTKWDWDTALVDHLLSYSGKYRAKIDEIVAIEKHHRGFTCSRLGVKKPVSSVELGQLIASDPKLVEELQDLFGVLRRRVFVPGVSYDEQRQQAIQEARRRRDELISQLRQERKS